MKQGKEVRVREKANKEPSIDGFNPDEFFNNRLSLTDAVKRSLKSQDLDWRFINAAQFRENGNQHRSHWRPHRFAEAERENFGANAEGFIQRGDLILAVRSKQRSAQAKSYVRKLNDRQSDANQSQARELKRQLRDNGVDSSVSTGYDEDSRGYKAVDSGEGEE